MKMKMNIVIEDKKIRTVTKKENKIGVPVYVPWEWFESQKTDNVKVVLALLPKEE